MRKKWCAAFFVVVLLPLSSESLRDQSKAYFDSIQWEELNNDLAIPPISEPYTIEGNRPIPYADTIDNGAILPSLPQLGVLDYQNIPEDVLTFCDKIAAAIVAKSIDNAFFSTQKAFLPHLGRFMFEHFPDFSHAFYGRPSFKQDGSATILLRLTVKPAMAGVPDENQDTALQQNAAVQQDAAMQHDAVIQQDTAAQQDTAVRNEEQGQDEAVQNESQARTALPAELTKGAETTVEEQTENISDTPGFFSDGEQPLFIMIELGAVKEDTAWKISYIDFKGAEYEDSALKD